MENLKSKLDNYLGNQPENKKPTVEEEGFEEICDLKTGECYTIKTKDGLIERVNKTMVTEDGRTLLTD
jgi:hypothetical protein|tara:strand:+ start:9957 stop:10160 length:204 start_codon:yes stop_codon:yes gene_type:complete